jgi:tetratricopeptide (TPR) repeat protein
MYRSALFIITAALATACGGARSPTSLQPSAALDIDRRAEHMVSEGQWDDARRLLDTGLDDARARGDRAGLARLLLRRGSTITDQTWHRGGDRSAARADLEAARHEAEAVGDRALIADSIDALGFHRLVGWFGSQEPAGLTGAEQLFRQALALRAPVGDSGALSELHFHVGLIHQMRGEHDAAGQAFAQALAIAERVHDNLRMAYATRHLGYLAELRRDWAAAEARYRQSLELRERVGSGPGVAAAQITLAELRYARDGNADHALDLLGRAYQGAAATHSALFISIASAAKSRVQRDRGHYEEAVRELTEAIHAMDAIHSDEDVPENFEQIALVQLLQGQPAAAVSAAERGIARRSSPRLEALRQLARVRTGQPVEPVAAGTDDAVVTARLALAAGRPDAALEAATRGDDPDTLLLAARALGPEGFDRAMRVAAAMSRAQELRFARELRR